MIVRLIASAALLAAVAGSGYGLMTWKAAMGAGWGEEGGGEPMESVEVALAEATRYQETTTAIGTVVALRSVSVRNEFSGTVAEVNLVPGSIVETGDVLVALDVSVEEADLKAQRATLAMAEAQLSRLQRASDTRAIPAMDLDRAQAERDVALAQIERTRAVIALKKFVAPFRARVGLHDLQAGQYLDSGTNITTLQGVDESTYVDFTVAQSTAARLTPGETVQMKNEAGGTLVTGEVIAHDARIDDRTRNATLRARVASAEVPAPGGSVVVNVPNGPERDGALIPLTALRRGPSGDYVFVITPDEQGNARAQQRRVTRGALQSETVVILEGLQPGEKVATSGSFKLREGLMVVEANAV